MDPYLKYLPIIPAVAATYMFGRALIADVRSMISSARDSAAPHWWARPIVVMTALVILAWTPIVIAHFNGTLIQPPSDAVEKAVADATDAFKSKVAGIEQERDTAKARQIDDQKRISELQAQLTAATTSVAVPAPKSPILGLDDAKRYNIVTAMESLTKSDPCMGAIASDFGSTPYGRRSIDTFAEVRQTLENAGWNFGQASKSFFPPGITIVSGVPRGHDRECALHLKDLLASLSIRPVSMTVDESATDLIACKCIEIILGKLESP
jgi:hypothetical protein